MRRISSLCPLVNVIEPLDIVLTEIAAGLYFDQFERDFSFVRQPMHAADGDVDRLIFMHRTDLFTDRHFCGATHHDPMLGAMAVLLQRKYAAGDDDDAFDLKPLAKI